MPVSFEVLSTIAISFYTTYNIRLDRPNLALHSRNLQLFIENRYCFKQCKGEPTLTSKLVLSKF